MKKMFLFLMLIGITASSYSQCTITGKTSIGNGSTQTYSVPSTLGQCSECYDWDIVSGNITQVSTSDQNNTFSIKATGLGAFQICVTYFDETGCHQCCLSGTTVACDITGTTINDVNQLGSAEVAFYVTPPNTPYTPTGFSYLWTFTFADGSTANSTSQVGKVDIDCSNRVRTVSVVITSALCTKTITKTYGLGNGGTDPGICGTSGMSKMGINVYPNPAKSNLNFEGKNLDQFKVTFYNEKGDVVIKERKLEKSFSIENLKPGIYVYQITNANGDKQEGKIVKE
ncbi:MAG: T9SS type A sorting domain-containing protein [Flavobacterium sp.]